MLRDVRAPEERHDELQPHGASVDICLLSGIHPLHRAVSIGDLDMVDLLLQFGANASERAAWGWYTPLHLACKYGHEGIIWLLLKHGANWNITDKVN
uniref:Uncharacterized protein n=1 Tax=Globisporangium ultimum (strain ATCC 200006 / CBS 805.95 / DAOM BR144) TaxID=431595 RepID=K3WNG3_GLOUD